jgi:hypothetical protein
MQMARPTGNDRPNPEPRSLAKVRLQLVCNPADDIVARREKHHAGTLASQLRALGAPLDERRITSVRTPGQDPGRHADESFDPWYAPGFLSEPIDKTSDHGTLEHSLSAGD